MGMTVATALGMACDYFERYAAEQAKVQQLTAHVQRRDQELTELRTRAEQLQAEVDAHHERYVSPAANEGHDGGE